MLERNQLKKIWLQVPPEYYEKGIKSNLLQKNWHEGKWRMVKSLARGKYRRILDVGCASGWLTARMAHLYPKAEVFGIDVSEKMCHKAKAIHPEVKFIQADAHKLPFEKGSLDLIIATEVLEHVVDPLVVLLEMKWVLSKSGEIIISMDTGNILFNAIWFFWTRGKGRVWKNSHLHRFNVRKLRQLFLKAGFYVEKEQIFNFGLAVAFKLRKVR